MTGAASNGREDIARASGIGRKSLYRYFPTQADLIWGGIEPVVEAAGVVLEYARTSGAPDGNILSGLRWPPSPELQ